MAYCGERSIVNGDEEGHVALSVRCRAWTCPDCMPTRKAGLIAQAIGGTPNKFLTLTLRRRRRLTAEQAAYWLINSWRKCRLKIMRWYGWSRLPFLAVVEKHKSGWPHLHILLRCPFIDHELLSEWMGQYCDGPNIWIEKLTGRKKCAVYASKYCGKATQKFTSAKRYWMSQDYDLRKNSHPASKRPFRGDWMTTDRKLRHIVAHWRNLGWLVTEESRWKASAVPRKAGADR